MLTKAKFLLFGLTKLPTLLSMLATMGIYFTAYGWKFAVGFVLSIYIHEMGHVAALTKFGIPRLPRCSFPASAHSCACTISSTPGRGCTCRHRRSDLGPGRRAGLRRRSIWSHAPNLGRARATGACINLFNLVPVWQLDGSRGFNALTKNQRLIACAAVLIAWMPTTEWLLL